MAHVICSTYRLYTLTQFPQPKKCNLTLHRTDLRSEAKCFTIFRFLTIWDHVIYFAALYRDPQTVFFWMHALKKTVILVAQAQDTFHVKNRTMPEIQSTLEKQK